MNAAQRAGLNLADTVQKLANGYELTKKEG